MIHCAMFLPIYMCMGMNARFPLVFIYFRLVSKQQPHTGLILLAAAVTMTCKK